MICHARVADDTQWQIVIAACKHQVKPARGDFVFAELQTFARLGLYTRACINPRRGNIDRCSRIDASAIGIARAAGAFLIVLAQATRAVGAAYRFRDTTLF